MYLILLCFALEFFTSKLRPTVFKIIIGILVAESMFVSAYPYYYVFNKDSFLCKTEIFDTLIVSNTIVKTVAQSSESPGSGKDFLLYFEANTGSKSTYEPNETKGRIRSVDDTDYQGEIYIVKGKGNVSIDTYTPGKIQISYDLDTISEIQLNTNYLAGWKSSDSGILVTKSDGILTIKPDKLSGKAVFYYRPDYLFVIIPLFIFGLFLSFVILARTMISSLKSKSIARNNS
jgi:uncharacterized membrane protein YfhO